MDIHTHLDDATIVNRLNRGGQEAVVAFGELMDAYFNSAAQVAYNVLRSRDTAKDAAQKVFAVIWEQRDTFRPTKSLRNYILTAARNRALKDIRHDKVEERYQQAGLSEFDDAAIQVNDVEQVENRATIETILARLPERRRQAVALRYLEQLSYAEIGEILQISAGAAEQLVIRAMGELKQSI